MSIRKPVPLVRGAGRITFLGHSGPADYVIEGDPVRMRFGVGRLRGSITIDPEAAREAFRAGEGVLELETGERRRLTMLAHSAGEAEIFVDVRV